MRCANGLETMSSYNQTVTAAYLATVKVKRIIFEVSGSAPDESVVSSTSDDSGRWRMKINVVGPGSRSSSSASCSSWPGR